MPRTNVDGRGLQAVLTYMLDRQVPATEIYKALGIARNTYHNRITEDDFPNAEECRLVAEALEINPLDLLVEFGLITTKQVEEYVHPLVPRSTSTTRPTTRIADLPRRDDVPPL